MKKGGHPMKPGIILRRTVFVLLMVIWTVSVAGAQDKPIVLKLAHHVPVVHAVHRDILEPWSRLVEKSTEGRVKIDIFPGGTLGGAPEQWDMAIQGRCDLSWGHQAHFPGRFPLTSVMELPFLGFPSAEAASMVAWELYQKTPEIRSEYPKVKMIFIHAGALFQLHMIKGKEIHKLEDFKGKKVRAPGDVAVKVLQSLGATPVGMPAPDTYLSLERGVIDGTLFAMDAVEGFKLAEVTRQHIVGNFYAPMFFLVMNLDAWAKLPPDIQKKIEKVSGAFGAAFAGKGWDNAGIRGVDVAKKAGNEIYQVPQTELVRWEKSTKPVYDAWLTEMQKKGLPGKKVLDEVLFLSEKYRKK
jgi:TRAP-type C4-dicarboxylate transport system substrate-binding protein